MGERDYASISLACIPKVRDDSEDFGRDLVDWCGHVSLESVSLENVDLEYVTHQLQSSVHFVGSSNLSCI